MVKKKIDNRIRVMIENGVKLGHRTMFVIVGNKARDQVPILYDILTKASVKARPTVLWCYKNKDEAISNHGKKRAKKIQSGKIDINESDLFDAFRVATTIHGRYYKDTHTILGKTYGVCVLQDFEALTPNLMARTVETVEGGGLIILLLKTISSLKQLYTMSMDVHKRYRTEAHQNVTCRFNERLILSLADCSRCLLVNDDLTVLPLSSRTADVKPIDVASIENVQSEQLAELKESLADAPPAGPLVNLCRTYDQAKAVAQFIDALAEKQLKPPTSLTAGRGRGKSAAMGLAIAGSIAFGYVNVYVTSPSPENLITLFEFILKGFDVLEYQEHTDYTIIRSTNPNFNKAIIRINITRNNRQTIQYISPTDAHLLNAADLLIIDEAAAIPLPMVRAMLGPYLVFMASTINGYEGTGRSLSLKLLSQLQKETNAPLPIKLEESIRYSPGDPVESWLTSLLCLDATIVQNMNSGCPPPDECQLYYVDRDALFSYHKAAETFLQRIVSICVSSHYKNSPNDLQMMSDAPAHHLFCLLGPIVKKNQLPEILVVIQVCLEGEISSTTLANSLVRGMKASGDLIPWNITEQFGDHEFPKLSGARIVRIATHPNYQRMGYGKRALNQLKHYYEGRFPIESDGLGDEQGGDDNGIETIDDDEVDLLKEVITPRKKIPTLLKALTERKPEMLDYLGTSYGLTGELLRFWKSQKFVPVYLSQKENELTGEHSCIMLCPINSTVERVETNEWLNDYFLDFRRRVLKLLGKSFNKFTTSLALSLLENKAVKMEGKALTQTTIDEVFLPHDVQRLEMYIHNQVEYKLIMDLTSDLASLYFQGKMSGAHIETLHKAILLGCGLQHKTIDKLMEELNMPSNQVLAKFYDCVKKLTNYILRTMESTIESGMAKPSELNMGENLVPLKQSLDDEFAEDVKTLEKQQKKELAKLKKLNLDQYAIKGTDEEWSKVLSSNKSTIVSIKSGEKRLNENADDSMSAETGDVSAFQKKKAKFGKKQKSRNNKG
ncbi:AGAP010491-PA [Anopheles gambiae str. PEST]|uniref:RNA cytidine acetyltransferase n=2 Tax=gambiae species complex TaxID=44542 RepID=Q7Q8Y1_ANOGA|nr:RNA cytidine acetyltransferase [Anopheles coluzzii]XP_314465.4 RNA cytidine acetyltransferase [Anopheles gambiae]EAA09908.4 AGAP010491-PA [Anopheles gambiae str. PEST]